MKLKFYTLLFILFLSGILLAQYPGGGGRGMNLNSGHIYGKIQDSVSGKALEYAVVTVLGYKYDTIKHSGGVTVITGDLTKSSGEFSLENLPVAGELTIRFTAMGYKTIERKFAFNIDFQKAMKQKGQGGDTPGSSMSGLVNMTDKDLGNIRMAGNLLKEVDVVSERPDVEIKLDKKVYNIEKNLTIAGGTAEDAMKTIPSVTVDLDGNVSMRNSSPQIFVDGRPTTLTIDQIPADAIESIEVISNPSAKYDASGGVSGIINIVLKKNRKTGYNGSVRVGVDMRGKINGGAELNVREGKINAFLSIGTHQRRSIGSSTTDRQNLQGGPLLTNIHQVDPSISDGYFIFLRGGFDYFINNRNTITVSGNVGKAHFLSSDSMSTRTDTLYPGLINSSNSYRKTSSSRDFNSLGASILFKHLFPKEGREWTADVNYNSNAGTTAGNYYTVFYDANGYMYRPVVQQRQLGSSTSEFITSQTDFTTPLKNNIKVEAGLRASIKNYTSSSNSYILNDFTENYDQLKAFGVNYAFTDQVYAAYGTFGQEFKKFSYQAGLRLESSLYAGGFTDSTVKYQYQYPVIPFPSLFATYHINDKDDIQLSYSRRINRPNFFQLIPATDYSDSLNIKRGNPALRPEFTNSLELNYLKSFGRSNTIMFTGFYKNSIDLITNYQVLEMNPILHRMVIINTYENALSSNSYGGEMTAKASIKKIVDLMANVNVYYTVIDASNVAAGLINKRTNWFTRLSATIHFSKALSLQLSGEYTAKSNLPLNSGGGGGRWGGMGGGFGGGGMGSPGATAQGYSLPVYFIDGGLKFDFLKDRKASLNLNAADILKSRIVQTHSESAYFIQDNSRYKDQLFFRLVFSYRFGKFDVSLFKRKNTKVNSDGMEMQQM
jgi:outer membrane receptor protein involved in Fe transport